MWKLLDRTATVSILAAAAVVAWVQLVPKHPGPVVIIPVEPQSIVGAQTIGNRKAPTAVIVYSDFECPYCKRFAMSTWPDLRREYVDSGRTIVVFRNLPLKIHPTAQKAAEGAGCAGRQSRFWEMHDAQFAAEGKLTRVALVSIAGSLGLDQSEFSDCLDGGSLASQVQEEARFAASLGIQSTPTFLIGRNDGGEHVSVSASIVGARPIEAFREALEGAMSKRRWNLAVVLALGSPVLFGVGLLWLRARRRNSLLPRHAIRDGRT
jgi:protein-disulfide isomerase